MKVLILYYSGTGNTKFACDAARLAIERARHEVAMTTYAKSGDLELGDYDLYCFATPVYEWAPSKNVESFIASMPMLKGKKAFILTSSAGAKGQATELFAHMLEQRGITLLGDFNLICPDSWGGTRRWSAAHDTEVPTVESVRDLARFVDRMLHLAARTDESRGVQLPHYKVKPTALYFASRLSRLAPSARTKMGTKKVDTAACTECGVCANNCPCGAITLEPYPMFGIQCIGCWRCVNTCPEDCITTGIDSRKHYKGIANKDELLKEAGLA